MGLSEKKMMEFLQDTDLSEDVKVAICKLISANNKQIEKEIPNVATKGIANSLKRSGKL